MDFQYILFDMDGVLMDSEPVITQAAMLGLKEFGVDAAYEDFHEFTGMGEDKFIGGVAQKHGVTYHTGMKKRVYDIYLEIVSADNLRVYEQTIPALKALKARGVRMALASSADHVKIAANLRVAGLDGGVFDVIIGGEDVANKKPAPDIYLLAAERLGCDPAHCLVIEDSAIGLAAAKAAGMRCMVTVSVYSRGEDFAQADIVVDDLDTPEARAFLEG